MWIMTPQSFHWPKMSQMKFHRHASHKFCISDTVQSTPSDLNQRSFFCWATLRLSIMEVTGTVKCNMPILLSKYSGINLFCIFHSTPHHLQPSTFSCCQSKCADRYLLPFTEAPFSPSCMHSRLSHSFSLSPPSLSHKHNLNNCTDYRLLSYNKFQIILTHTNAYRQVC